jgi:hypothetical protein
MAKDIFKEKLLRGEGMQAFSRSESNKTLKMFTKSERKIFGVFEEKRPSYFSPSEWKKTFSIQRKDKMRILKNLDKRKIK